MCWKLFLELGQLQNSPCLLPTSGINILLPDIWCKKLFFLLSLLLSSCLRHEINVSFAPLCLPKWRSPCNQNSLNALWMLGTVHGCRLTRNMCWGLGEPWFVGETWQLQLAFAMGYVQFSSFQLLSHVQLFETPWTAARQASLSFTNSWILLKLMSIESVIPSNYLIFCHPLLLLPSIFPSISVFSNESVTYHQVA